MCIYRTYHSTDNTDDVCLAAVSVTFHIRKTQHAVDMTQLLGHTLPHTCVQLGHHALINENLDVVFLMPFSMITDNF
jgi:hypothetical protein